MKKILCLVMAIAAIGCFAACTNHNDGVCDKCDTTIGVIRYDEKTELCPTHAAEELKKEIEKDLNN